jgi:hypothetical protein
MILHYTALTTSSLPAPTDLASVERVIGYDSLLVQNHALRRGKLGGGVECCLVPLGQNHTLRRGKLGRGGVKPNLPP